MDYAIQKSQLSSDLLAETLEALATCYAALGMQLYVVGAAARDLAMTLLHETPAPRRTLDLDVAVLLEDWSQYQRLTDILLQHHFEKQPARQRFLYRGPQGQNRYEVDIVPFGGIARDGLVAWPPEGSPVMSVRCFAEVMRHADTVTVDDRFSLRLAPLSGQWLIKLDAWTDRHLSTRKDAGDMYYIMDNAFTAFALSRPCLSPMVDIEATTFDPLVAGAEWIADDLRGILPSGQRQYYADLLKAEADQEDASPLIDNMLDYAGTSRYQPILRALVRMAEILAI